MYRTTGILSTYNTTFGRQFHLKFNPSLAQVKIPSLFARASPDCARSISKLLRNFELLVIGGLVFVEMRAYAKIAMLILP
jgi:hypothetical protein